MEENITQVAKSLSQTKRKETENLSKNHTIRTRKKERKKIEVNKTQKRERKKESFEWKKPNLKSK